MPSAKGLVFMAITYFSPAVRLSDEEKNFYYLYYKRDNSTSTKLSRFSTEIGNLFAPIINAM